MNIVTYAILITDAMNCNRIEVCKIVEKKEDYFSHLTFDFDTKEAYIPNNEV